MRWERPDAMTANAMLASGLMIAQMTEAKAVRDSVFLTHFPATSLPTMTLVAALFAMASSYAGSRLMRATTPDRFAPIAFLISGLLQIGERSLLYSYPRASACVIYLHVFAINLVLTSSFWSLMNEHYDPRSAKKAFGKIAGMGTFGGIMGGLIAERVAAMGSIYALMLVTAVLHMACGAALWRFTRKHPIAHRAEKKTGEKHVVRNVLRKSPYLLELAALMISVSVAAGLVDYLFKSQAAANIAKGPGLTRFFAVFYTTTGVLGVCMQTFASSAMLSRFGLATTVSSLPFAVAAGGGGLLAFFGFVELTILRGLEVVLRSSLYRSGYELFYTPVPSSEKRAVKALIDVNGERLGDAIGSGIVGLLLILHGSGKWPILTAAIAFSGVGLVLARRLERSYVGALEKSLTKQSGPLEAGPGLGEFLDSGIIVPVTLPVAAATHKPEPVAVSQDPVLLELQELRSPDENRAIQALIKTQAANPMICHQLIQFLSHESYGFLAMEKLRRVAAAHVGLLADTLLRKEEPFAIRKRIPLILARSGSQRAVDSLVMTLSDEDFQIRFRSAYAIDQLRMESPQLHLNPERVWRIVEEELHVSRDVWEVRRLMEAQEDTGEIPGEASLEYLFALLGLVLPREPVTMAYRALHTQDRHLRGTALEYLQTVLPGNAWKSLEILIGERAIRSPLTMRPPVK
ncbi:MAG: hypothetical protein HYZ37_07185 [Candidatus Solibacter usitatus]|nr:hypothetical protein [Candidatus Solibacter usitatus]